MKSLYLPLNTVRCIYKTDSFVHFRFLLNKIGSSIADVAIGNKVPFYCCRKEQRILSPCIVFKAYRSILFSIHMVLPFTHYSLIWRSKSFPLFHDMSTCFSLFNGYLGRNVIYKLWNPLRRHSTILFVLQENQLLYVFFFRTQDIEEYLQNVSICYLPSMSFILFSRSWVNSTAPPKSFSDLDFRWTFSNPFLCSSSFFVLMSSVLDCIMIIYVLWLTNFSQHFASSLQWLIFTRLEKWLHILKSI